jgi:hypothetical protein
MKRKLTAKTRRDCPIQVNLTAGELKGFDARVKDGQARTRAEYLYRLILKDISATT